MTGSPADLHRAAIEVVIARTLAGSERVISVDSPPGAGKSELVVIVTDEATRTAGAQQVAVVTQTNEQADDVTRRLAARFAGGHRLVGRLHRDGYNDPEGLAGQPRILLSNHVDHLDDCVVVVAPAMKWAFTTGHWDLGIIDEVYQMRSDMLLRIGEKFDRLLAVGDPGQLSPFTTGDERLVRGIPLAPIETAAATLKATWPHEQVALPVSWRLTPSAAELVSRSFYLRSFTSGCTPDQRRLEVGPTGLSKESAVWDVAAKAGWAYVELPPALLGPADPEMASTVGNVVHSVLGRGAVVHDADRSRPLAPSDVAVGVAHRSQRGIVRAEVDRRLGDLGIPAGRVIVETANRLQGRQFELMVVWHPLSGRRDASAFHLEAGRLCVLLSRHRQACVVVSRGGVADALQAYPASDPVWVSESILAVDGWEANLAVLEQLKAFRTPSS